MNISVRELASSMCQTAIPISLDHHEDVSKDNRYAGNYSLVGGREVVSGGQLLGGYHPRAAILSAVDLLLDELGRRLGRLQNP